MPRLKLSDADFLKKRDKLIRESLQKAATTPKNKKMKKAPSKRKRKVNYSHK